MDVNHIKSNIKVTNTVLLQNNEKSNRISDYTSKIIEKRDKDLCLFGEFCPGYGGSVNLTHSPALKQVRLSASQQKQIVYL